MRVSRGSRGAGEKVGGFLSFHLSLIEREFVSRMKERRPDRGDARGVSPAKHFLREAGRQEAAANEWFNQGDAGVFACF